MIATFISGQFSVPIVPFPEWLAKLEEYSSQYGLRVASANTPDKAPNKLHALQIMYFYRAMAERVRRPGPMAIGMSHMDMAEALKASSTLADPELKQLQVQDVRMWLNYWRKMGMFSQIACSNRSVVPYSCVLRNANRLMLVQVFYTMLLIA